MGPGVDWSFCTYTFMQSLCANGWHPVTDRTSWWGVLLWPQLWELQQESQQKSLVPQT